VSVASGIFQLSVAVVSDQWQLSARSTIDGLLQQMLATTHRLTSRRWQPAPGSWNWQLTT